MTMDPCRRGRGRSHTTRRSRKGAFNNFIICCRRSTVRRNEDGLEGGPQPTLSSEALRNLVARKSHTSRFSSSLAGARK